MSHLESFFTSQLEMKNPSRRRPLALDLTQAFQDLFFIPQLSLLVEAQKCSSKQTTEQLEEVSRSLTRQEEQERKNKHLTTLLHQDRDRFVHQIND